MKRVRCEEDQWPSLFLIKDVARLIVPFLPELQYRQWIVVCENKQQQTQLCEWRRSSYCNIHVQFAIAKHKNWDAFIQMVPFIQDWNELVPVLSLDMLEYALQHAPQKPQCCYVDDSSLEQLKIFVRYLTFDAECQSRMISSTMLTHDRLRLDWMLNDQRWSGCIRHPWYKNSAWNDDLWTIVENSVKDGRLTFENRKLMPRKMLQCQAASMTMQKRKQIFTKYQTCFDIAEVFWLPEFEIDILDSDFETLDSALSLIGSSPTTPEASFRLVLLAKITSILDALCFSDRVAMFRQCFSNGLPDLAKFIWTMSDTLERDQLRPLFKHAGSSNDMTLVAFAFEELQSTDVFESYMTSWFEVAFDQQNSPLLQFLMSKNLEHCNHLSNNSNFLYNIAAKKFPFVSLMWSTHEPFFLCHIDEFFCLAMDHANFNLVEFLCDYVEVLPPQFRIVDHIRELAEMGCINTIRKIPHNTYLSMQSLCAAYASAFNADIVRALYATQKNTTLDAECFSQALAHVVWLERDRDLEKCVQFVKLGFITTRKLHDVINGDQDINYNTTWWKSLFPQLYYDVDI